MPKPTKKDVTIPNDTELKLMTVSDHHLSQLIDIAIGDSDQAHDAANQLFSNPDLDNPKLDAILQFITQKEWNSLMLSHRFAPEIMLKALLRPIYFHDNPLSLNKAMEHARDRIVNGWSAFIHSLKKDTTKKASESDRGYDDLGFLAMIAINEIRGNILEEASTEDLDLIINFRSRFQFIRDPIKLNYNNIVQSLYASKIVSLVGMIPLINEKLLCNAEQLSALIDTATRCSRRSAKSEASFPIAIASVISRYKTISPERMNSDIMARLVDAAKLSTAGTAALFDLIKTLDLKKTDLSTLLSADDITFLVAASHDYLDAVPALLNVAQPDDRHTLLTQTNAKGENILMWSMNNNGDVANILNWIVKQNVKTQIQVNNAFYNPKQSKNVAGYNKKYLEAMKNNPRATRNAWLITAAADIDRAINHPIVEKGSLIIVDLFNSFKVSDTISDLFDSLLELNDEMNHPTTTEQEQNECKKTWHKAISVATPILLTGINQNSKQWLRVKVVLDQLSESVQKPNTPVYQALHKYTLLNSSENKKTQYMKENQGSDEKKQGDEGPELDHDIKL